MNPSRTSKVLKQKQQQITNKNTNLYNNSKVQDNNRSIDNPSINMSHHLQDKNSDQNKTQVRETKNNYPFQNGNMLNINMDKSNLCSQDSDLDRSFQNLLTTKNQPKLKCRLNDLKFDNIFKRNSQLVRFKLFSNNKNYHYANEENNVNSNSNVQKNENLENNLKDLEGKNTELNSNNGNKIHSDEINQNTNRKCRLDSTIISNNKVNQDQLNNNTIDMKFIGQKRGSENMEKIHQEMSNLRTNSHNPNKNCFRIQLTEDQTSIKTNEASAKNSQAIQYQTHNNQIKYLSIFDRFFLAFKNKIYHAYLVGVKISEEKTDFEFSYVKFNKEFVIYKLRYNHDIQQIMWLEKQIDNRLVLKLVNENSDAMKASVIFEQLRFMLEDISVNVQRKENK